MMPAETNETYPLYKGWKDWLGVIILLLVYLGIFMLGYYSIKIIMNYI